jgi:hypothetical protein
MSTYSPPTASGIIFDFIAGGYTPPSASRLAFPFVYRPSYSSTSDLQAAIEVYNFQTSTYTYVKKRNIQVLGYSQYKVQILKGKTEYGGIRDLGATIYRQPRHVDLAASIVAVADYLDLAGFIRSTIQSYVDLGAQAGGHLPADLSAYIKATVQSYKNLNGYILPTTTASLDLAAAIRRGYSETVDLGSIIGTHPPADLQAIINVIEIMDLPAVLIGEFYKGEADLGGWIPRIFGSSYVDLGTYIRSLMMEFDLPASMNIIEIKDLRAYTRTQYRSTKNLNALVGITLIKNLPAIIHGYATMDLGGLVAGVYGPYDLQAYIRVHPYLNLPGSIHGWYSGTWNLRAMIDGAYSGVFNLPAEIVATGGFGDLAAIIVASGGAFDLAAYIFPRTILLKKAILVPLMEHKDLGALINFMCFGSDSRNLSAFVHALYKLDLRAEIIGWYGGTSDNIKDLGAYINCGVFNVIDQVLSVYIPILRYTKAKVAFGSFAEEHCTAFDVATIGFSTYFYKNLSAYIRGEYRYSDLTASIAAKVDYNYSQLPEYIRPRTREVVVNTKQYEEQFKYFVNLMFETGSDAPFQYFYVSGSQRVYKIDRDRTWTIWMTSYLETDEFIEKANVRRKYLFNLNKYSSIDAAIRDLIDRVTAYEQLDLTAEITGIT